MILLLVSRKRNSYMKVRVFVLIVSFLFVFQFATAQEEITLEEMIALALSNNYDVQLSKNASLAASTDRNYAWAAFLPQFNATAAILWNQNEQTLRFQDVNRNNSGEAQSENMSASVQMNWTLFDGTKMFATNSRIRTIEAQGELIVKDQMVNTVANVITSYYDVVRQKQQLRALQEQMAVSEERVKLADRKLQVGTGAKPELLQARVDYNAQRTQILQQEATIIQLKESLNALVGEKLPATFDVADSIVINMNLLSDGVSNLEQTNYTLQAMKLNMEIAALERRERRAELSPVLSFNSAANYNQTDNIRLINPFAALYSKSDGINYGFTLTIPILNGLNTRRLIKQSEINYGRQKLFFDQQKTTLNAQLKNAYVNYENAKKVLEIQEETILLARENVSIALESFKRSAMTAIELRTAQQSLADVYNSVISARYNAKVAETELLRISGALIK
jgi:outer membrane protein